MATQNETSFRLSDVEVGRRAIIDFIHTDMDPIIKRRLLALGFVAGSQLEVIRRAPFGDPTEYQVRGSRISLRKSESQFIFLR